MSAFDVVEARQSNLVTHYGGQKGTPATGIAPRRPPRWVGLYQKFSARSLTLLEPDRYTAARLAGKDF